MNEKIRELAEQFRMNFSINGNPQDGIHWDDVEKFAELIVKECIKQCEQVAVDADKTSKSKLVTGDGHMLHEGMWGGATNCGEQIKEHFGID